jgi:hypothetical protein
MLWYETTMNLTLYRSIRYILFILMVCFLIPGCGNFDPFYAAMGNPLFLIFAGNGMAWSSPDGERWVSTSIPGSYFVLDAVYAEHAIFAVTMEGYGVWSNDGKSWTSVSIGTTDTTAAIAYGNNRYVIVGQGGYPYWSSDGTTWNMTSIPSSCLLYDIVYWSFEGISWIDVSIGGYNIYSIAYGHNTFVAIGDDTEGGQVLWSHDGISWQRVHLGSVRPQRIIYDIGRFIVAGENGNIWVSKDGKSWFNRKLSTTDNLHGVAYGIDRFIAVGDNGRICWSHKGNTWVESTIEASSDFSTIIYRP